MSCAIENRELTSMTRKSRSSELPTANLFFSDNSEEVNKMFVSRASLPDSSSVAFTVNRDDEADLKVIFQYIKSYVSNGSLSKLVQVVEDDAEMRLMEFKRSVKDNPFNEHQYKMIQHLNDIEKKSTEYPFLSAKEAIGWYGIIGSRNPTRDIAKLADDCKLFVFHFGESKTYLIPAFQFKEGNLGVYKPVSQLCKFFKGLDDWTIYNWFTTYDADLECTPAAALADTKKHSDLIDLAGLFKNLVLNADLSFVASRKVD